VDRIRVILADDHRLVRAGIRSLLEKLPGLEVVAEASDGREAIQLIAKHQPDVVLMDIAMPVLNGLEATRCAVKDFPTVRVVILSIYSDEEHVYQALRAGAAGYLLKGAAIQELEVAIRAVAQGETYLSPPVSKPLIDAYVRPTHAGHPENLSPRQSEVLQLIARGKTTKETALALKISVKTVETHRAALMKRIGVRDVAGLVRYAIKIGLVDLR
jgi:DNA-binding NarL/FixJ family response regulator